MILKYDEKQFLLYVQVGTDEEFIPCEDIKELDKKLKKFKAKLIKLKDKEGSPLMEEVKVLLAKYNKGR